MPETQEQRFERRRAERVQALAGRQPNPAQIAEVARLLRRAHRRRLAEEARQAVPDE